jgi:hypothetical protein
MSDVAPKGKKYTYRLLCDELGREKAHQIIAAKLRAFADAIESNNDPGVYSCTIDNLRATACGGDIMESINVTLSHPWPG